jgi:hypothetical protein
MCSLVVQYLLSYITVEPTGRITLCAVRSCGVHCSRVDITSTYVSTCGQDGHGKSSHGKHEKSHGACKTKMNEVINIMTKVMQAMTFSRRA